MTTLMTTESIKETAAYLVQGFTTTKLSEPTTQRKNRVIIDDTFDKADVLDTIMFSIHREICGDFSLPIDVLYDFTLELMESLADMDSNIGNDDEQACEYLYDCIYQMDATNKELTFWLYENPSLNFSFVEDAVKEIHGHSIPEDFRFADMIHNGMNLQKQRIGYCLIQEICSLMG